MKLVLLIALIALFPVLATGQARTAERIVSVAHSQLGTTAPNGSVRHVINGLEGTTPCQAGGSGAIAYRINGVWECPKLTAGVGTGDVTGPSASAVGEMAIYSSTTGKNIGRSNTLNGLAFLTNGIVTGQPSTGTGDVVRSAGATITGVNASNIFAAGTVPPVRIISGTLTNQRCLRLSNTGQIEVAANDCGTGGGGSPGGVSGNLAYNEAGAFGGLSNTSYDATSGRLTFSQKADGNDTVNLLRFTDTSPTGTLLRARNAANNADLFVVNASGSVFASSTVTIANTAAPATPAAGNTVLWTDSTDKNLRAQDDAGNVSGTVRAVTCTGTDKISAISSAGVPTCTADQGGSGTGVITLNGLNTSDQSFAKVDDTNVTFTISSVTSTHTFTLGWTGTLAKARQNAATVYNDAANTWTTGAQSFAAVSSLAVPSATGAAPSASGLIAYDLTTHTLEYGENGTNRTVANTAGSQTFANKTLDNSNTLNIRDTLLILQDNTDSTKTVNFELSGITTGTNRVVTIANAASVTVQPTTATANQVVSHIDNAGVQQKVQLSFANLSGTMGATQGGTDQTAVAQGDLLFGSATNAWSRLAKSTSATRYLSNTGASNNPAWAQVDLTNGVTGLLPPANWSVLTTKGDLTVHNGTTTTRLPVSTDGFALLADSTQTAGVKWAAISASAGGSNTQLQRNNAGALGGITGATSDGTAVTFSAGNLIVGNIGAAPTPSLGRLYVDSDDNKLYYGINGTDWGEVFVSGLSVVNLASANVTGVLPVANGGTSFSDTTFSGSTHKLVTTTGTLTSGRCAEWDASGNLIQAAGACGGSGSPGGSDTQVQFNDGGAFGGDAGLTYNKTTDALTVAGSIAVGATGAGYLELAEGTAPSAVANRVSVAAPTDVTAGGWVLSLPTTAGTTGQFLQTNGSGVTTWASPAGAGTVTHTGGALTANAVVLGAGTDDTKVVAGIVTDGTSKLTLGVAGTSVGSIDFANATSGTITLSPVTGALGTVTLSLPARTATVATTTGTLTTGRCVEIDASGNFIQSAAACSAGSGTINSGATNTLPKYTAATTLDDSLLSDDGTNLIYGGSGQGSIALKDSDASHYQTLQFGSNLTADRTLTITTGDAARTLDISGGNVTLAGAFTTSGANALTLTTTGSTNVTLPTTGTLITADGSATLTNKAYDTAGTGNSFTSSHKVWLPGAGCQGTVAASFWDLPTATPAVATCVTGTNTQKGYLDFADTSGGFSAQTTLQLPDDFTGTVDADIYWLTTATTGNAKWSLSVSCTNTDATQTDDQAFETASTATTAAPGIASRVQTSSITSLTITNCGANDILHVKVFRDGNDAADTIAATARFYGLRLTMKRAQ